MTTPEIVTVIAAIVTPIGSAIGLRRSIEARLEERHVALKELLKVHVGHLEGEIGRIDSHLAQHDQHIYGRRRDDRDTTAVRRSSTASD